MSATPLSSLQKILAVLILLVVVFFSLFHLTESPPFGFDEGWAFHLATNISRVGESVTQFSPGHLEHSSLISVGYPLLYPLASWFKLFGIGILQARLMMVLYMFAFLIVSFILLRRLYGNTIALGSLAILATFPPFYTFGKSVIGEVSVLFFLTLFLLFFNLATSNPEKKRFWFILAGISAGLCIVTKTMALAFIPVLFVGAILAFRKGLVSLKDIGIVAISVIIPIGVWIIVNFQPENSLIVALDYYSNPSVLTDRAATFWLNLRMFFSGIGPLFMLSLITAWIMGVAIRLKAKMKISIEESIALIFSVVLILSFLFRYWDARYLFPVQILGILFAPYSLYYILLALPIKLNLAKKTKIFLLGMVVLFGAGLYQLSFHSYIADSYKSKRTEDMSEYFSSVPDSTSIFFYNTPEALAFFHGSNYYQQIQISEKWFLGSDFSEAINDRQVDMLVINWLAKKDKGVSLGNYMKVAEFGKILILKRETK